MEKKVLVIANWKMNSFSKNEIKEYLSRLNDVPKNVKLLLSPNYLYIDFIKSKTNFEICAQNSFFDRKGNNKTGETSNKMLKDFGINYVLVGHDERRKYFYEGFDMLEKKIINAVRYDLKVIFCFGENKVENFEKELLFNLNFIKNINKKYNLTDNIYFAYEPVFCINSNISFSYEIFEERIKFIKNFLIENGLYKKNLLFGGSVNSKNIKIYFKNKIIDGFLIGKSSLNGKDFSILLDQLA